MRHRLDSIQILRAFAAISVVISHAIDRATRAFPAQAPYSFLANFQNLQRLGQAGVDIFFVISGFIMMYVHYEQFGDQGAPRRFIGRRIIRVVPLYWTLTALAVVLLTIAPKLFFFHSSVDVPWVVGSFLFIMIAPHSGPASPIIGQGWTLDFEMFFYIVFASALLIPRRRAIVFIFTALGLLIAVGSVFPARPVWLSVWTSPLLAEFFAGITIAVAYKKGLPIFSKRVGKLVLVLGLLLFGTTIWLDTPGAGWLRPLHWGIPATLVVWGALSLEFRSSPWVSLGTLLGDASYSIYMFQAIALPFLAIALKALLRGHSMPVDLAVCFLIGMAVTASVGCWYIVERPMTRFLNASLRKREYRDTV